MYRLVILLFCLLASLPFAQGQELKVEISPVFNIPLKQVFQKHLFFDETGHYVYFFKYWDMAVEGQSRRASVVFEKYDPRFNLVFSKDLEEVAPKAYSAGVVFLGDQFVWIRTERNPSDNNSEVRLTPIALNGEIGQPVLIASEQFEGKFDLPETKWMLSSDTSKLLLATYSDKNLSEWKLEMALSVTDAHLQTIWKSRFKFPYTEKQLDIQSWVVGNNGDVYMLSKVFDDDSGKEARREEGEKVAAYKMVVFKFEAGSKTPGETVLDLGGAFVKEAQMVMSPGENIGIVGLFSNDYKGLIQGVFFMERNPVQGAVLSVNKKEFSPFELERIGYKNVDIRQGELGLLNSFSFGKLMFLKDGSAFVTIEPAAVATTIHPMGDSGFSVSSTYTSGDIIVLQFDPDGAFRIIHKIPKQQSNSWDLSLGHSAFSGDEKVYFFYNENQKNLEKSLEEKPATMVNLFTAIGALTSIDANGNIERAPLLGNKEIKSFLVPKMCMPIGEKYLFFVAVEGKFLSQEIRLGRVLLPDGGR